MGTLNRLGASALLLLLSAPAWAGSVYQAVIVANPQMQVKAGRVEGCGFQLKAIAPSAAGDKAPVMLDISFNAYASMINLMKGGASRVNLKEVNKGVNLPIRGFWLKPDGKQSTTPIEGKVLPAETPGYLLYGSDFMKVFELFDAVLKGQEVMMGVHINGEPVERIYAGTPTASDDEKRQITRCLQELLGRMEADLGAAEAKGNK